ncbi:MAG: TetR/AcrR family transcriptional regulator [Rhodomicrobium sp.]|nr:TetR/AcrR family transcriptional regulator [Rhodomicrobium sp.]
MKILRFQRARSPEHKAERERAILQAASIVLGRDGIESTTLNAIAHEARLAKSNLYRYFESREEILIRLLGAEAGELITGVAGAYAELAVKDDLERMARIFAQACNARPRFCLLISQMAPILERNISIQRVIEVKRGFVPMLEAMAGAIHRAAPSLGADGAEMTLKTGVTLVAGLWPVAYPPPTVAEALKHPDIAHLHQDFEGTLARTMVCVMEGIRARRAQGLPLEA